MAIWVVDAKMLVYGAVRCLCFAGLDNHLVTVGSVGCEKVLVDITIGPAVIVWFVIKEPGI
jgi:hypothetical protein